MRAPSSLVNRSGDAEHWVTQRHGRRGGDTVIAEQQLTSSLAITPGSAGWPATSAPGCPCAPIRPHGDARWPRQLADLGLPFGRSGNQQVEHAPQDVLPQRHRPMASAHRGVAQSGSNRRTPRRAHRRRQADHPHVVGGCRMHLTPTPDPHPWREMHHPSPRWKPLQRRRIHVEHVAALRWSSPPPARCR